MTRVIMSPNKYIQGQGELSNLAFHVSLLGNSAFIITDEFVFNLVGSIVKKSFEHLSLPYHIENFRRECCQTEIDRLREICKMNRSNIIIGLGGGKALDIAKAVAYYENLPAAIVPTSASTDAPCSAVSVIYTEEGTFDKYLVLRSNPNLIIMDTQVIANAPVRLFTAGMGDALSTYFEAKACAEASKSSSTGRSITKAALGLAKLCYETLLTDGLKAKMDVEKNLCTEAVENIVEANTYLSGIGFESGGLAAAHSIHNGLTLLEGCRGLYHGEKVAFGTVVQLVLEKKSTAEINQVIQFCKSVGLPTTLKEMGIEEANREDLMQVAAASCAKGQPIHNMPYKISPEMVFSAILTTDTLAKNVTL